MKKLIIAAASLGLVISSGHAQGIFDFDNSANFGSTALLPTIGVGNFGEGNNGQVIGSDPTHATPNYDITYLWMPGTTYSGQHLDPVTFMSLGGMQGAIGTFDAHTGNTAGGAGVVEGGFQTLPGVSGGTSITIELIAYYDPTGTGTGTLPTPVDSYGNYAHNIGWSQLETIKLATGGPIIPDISSIPAFTVNAIIPEPSIPALFGVGAAVLVFARCRKIKGFDNA